MKRSPFCKQPKAAVRPFDSLVSRRSTRRGARQSKHERKTIIYSPRKLSLKQLWILRWLASHGPDYAWAMSKEHDAPPRNTIAYNLERALSRRGLVRDYANLDMNHVFARWVEITESGLKAIGREKS